jgi:methionine biosynthesis protein MetW
MASPSPDLEHHTILAWIDRGASVLDLGCGDGAFLADLVAKKQVAACGIDIDERAIYQCVARGLSVFHQDLDTGLSEYADRSFDYVILKQSLQQVRHPAFVLQEATRVGHKAIVSLPNFAYYAARFQICFRGRVPVTPALPYEWHDSPNIHFLSILDFLDFCAERTFRIENSLFIRHNRVVRVFPNFFAETAIFLLSRKNGAAGML